MPPADPTTIRRLRDLAALLMLLLGIVGVSLAAFAVDWRLGTATVSAVLITAGVLLGLDR